MRPYECQWCRYGDGAFCNAEKPRRLVLGWNERPYWCHILNVENKEASVRWQTGGSRAGYTMGAGFSFTATWPPTVQWGEE